MPLESFHPTLRRWFRQRFDGPTAAQRRGWPAIERGEHVLIAAPTGSGKTLAAFLWALDGLLRQGTALAERTQVLYVSPLKALGNDVRLNLERPLEELRALDGSLPQVRVLVRSGDTPQSARTAMRRKPPHVLVTTPESLYILLTSEGGRELLRGVRTAIADEIHAVLGDKRGAHLALSLERLEALSGPVQRIGLSATQRPIEDVGRFLCGAGRECTLIDEGHLRELDLAVEIPQAPLETVCSHETWEAIYRRVAELVRAHRTTLVFVGTRKMAERASRELLRFLEAGSVACHHSSLSRERRLEAEARLKSGSLCALVATASLELGIDIGDVDLVVQLGTTRSIATLLQRVGRSGHGVRRTPKGRLFPLTRDELVESLALLESVRGGVLDHTPQPAAPLDILAQQIVAACAAEPWSEDELFARLVRAWPYRHLARERFDQVVGLHARGRRALLHRSQIPGEGARLRGTRRARLTAITSGGAIPQSAQYRVVLEPQGTFIGTLDEDFAIESTGGDVFQLGNSSWRVLRLQRGTMHVADAQGAPPSLPFWLGEAPARTRELSAAVGAVRERALEPAPAAPQPGFPAEAARQLSDYIEEGHSALGAVPSPGCVVLERFFDESGGTQLVVHALYGSRINRAFGLALRKRFCRRFGFELQAAANEDAIVLSLGPHSAFPLEEVLEYLQPESVRDVLVQALLVTPLFKTRWRWNVQRGLLIDRVQHGKRTPPQLLRMRADDLLAEAFPEVAACGENVPAGDLVVPDEHPLVAQTLEDCLHEAMDLDGLIEVLEGLRRGSIRRMAVDTPAPSAFARSILSARPYAFLDDAPLEERRTQAVAARRVLDPRAAQGMGELDPAAVERVRSEAWPDPRDAEELHEALLWMGYVADEEAGAWQSWLDALAAQGRVFHSDGRWRAAEATRDPKEVLRGRLQALGPVQSDDPLLLDLEAEGAVMRTRLSGALVWCDRRLLARIQRYTLETLRRGVAPVSPAAFQRFLCAWQHLDEERRLDGPGGAREVLRQLAGFEATALDWERRILPARVRGWRPEWLDALAQSGEIAWGRLWGSSRLAPRATPVALVPREELAAWLALAAAPASEELSWPARAVHERLSARGALFPADLSAATKLIGADLERGLSELIALGWVTNDSFAALRHLVRPAWRRRRQPAPSTGRWSLFRTAGAAAPDPEHLARALLRRYGVVFRAVLERARSPLPWRELARVWRALELSGEVRGGRFVSVFAGEQFALPEAVPLLRKLRDEPLSVDLAPDDPARAPVPVGLGEPTPVTRTG